MRKSIIPNAQKTVVAVGKRVAKEAEMFIGEVADAAAAAAATTKAMTGAVLSKIATALEARSATGAEPLAREAATSAAAGGKPSSRAKRKVAKGAVAKKRVTPKKKATRKKMSRKVANKERS
jgi:hypothetical protein